MSDPAAEFKFGDLKTTPYSEPSWYDSRNHNAWFTPDHVAFRNKIREWMDKEIMPFVDEWEAAGSFPMSLFDKAGEIGLLSAIIGWPEDVSPLPRPKGWDALMSMIAVDELARSGSGGLMWFLAGGLGIGLGPVYHGSELPEHREVVKRCVQGKDKICLAVSEPHAGSDLANLQTTAHEEGDFLRINGQKKWITGGMYADWMTTAVKLQDGSQGFAAIRLVLIPTSAKGVSRREMNCMGAKGSGTSFIELDDVMVHKRHIVGDASLLLKGLIAERTGIAIQANRFARVCLKEAIVFTRRRKAFGKYLVEQPVVRNKLAQMMKAVEATQAYIESLVGRVAAMERNNEDWFEGILRLGSDAALAKVLASETFEFCARESALLQGGQAYVKGTRIESLYRDVISMLTPGGALTVLLDSAARLSLQGKL